YFGTDSASYYACHFQTVPDGDLRSTTGSGQGVFSGKPGKALWVYAGAAASERQRERCAQGPGGAGSTAENDAVSGWQPAGSDRFCRRGAPDLQLDIRVSVLAGRFSRWPMVQPRAERL